MRKPILAEGDYVRFLNDRLEGRITRILPGEKAVVEIEDGFPVETVFSELVKIEESAPRASRQTTQPQPENGPLLPSSPFPLEPGVHFLLVPYPGQVHSGPWQVQLHNTGKSPVLFSIFFEKPLRNSSTNDFGLLPPAGMVVLGDATSEQESVATCDIFLMIHDKSLTDSKRHHRFRCTPASPGLQARFPALQSPFSFSSTTCVWRFEDPEQGLTILPEQIRQMKEALSGSGRATAPPSQTSEASASRNEFIVDLHIEAISDGKEPGNEKQLLALQLKHFKKALDRAILGSYSNIFFIHGVGNGILRKAIRDELDILGLRYSDGPNQRFGRGATQVHL